MDKTVRRLQKENLAWYIKWGSSLLLILAMCMRSTGVAEYQVIDLLLSTVGVFGWLLVGLLWKDRALILLNGVGLSILLVGVLKYFG